MKVKHLEVRGNEVEIILNRTQTIALIEELQSGMRYLNEKDTVGQYVEFEMEVDEEEEIEELREPGSSWVDEWGK